MSRCSAFPALRAWSLVTLAVHVAACNPKDAPFFGPITITNPPVLVDVTSPTISNQLPFGNVVLNDVALGYDAIDGPGAAGEPISGLNIPGMTAAASGTSLPISGVGTGNGYLIDITLLTDGLNTVLLRTPDLAGNPSSYTYTFRKDRTAPTLTAQVPATGSTDQPNARVNLTGTFADQHGISAGTMYVRQAQNGQCTTTGAFVPQGTNPGNVGLNPVNLSTLGGQFDIGVDLYGAPTDMRPRTTTYCFHFAFADPAVNRLGAPAPNTTDRLFAMTYTWQAPAPSFGNLSGSVIVNGTSPLAGVTVTAGGQTTTTNSAGQYTFSNLLPGSYTVAISNVPSNVQCNPLSKQATVVGGQTTVTNFDCTRTDFTITLQVTYVHVGPGLSYACVRILGALASARDVLVPLENIAGATWTATWTGPAVEGGTTRNGVLDANSQALDRQQISDFGTYSTNVSVTYNGVTKQATGSVGVGGAQGTCTPP